MSRVRVFVADDHPMYREGLVRAIKERPDLELVGESSDGRTALPEIRRLAPDVAVLDVRMPGLTGTDVLNAIARERITTRVVFLSAHVDSALVYTPSRSARAPTCPSGPARGRASTRSSRPRAARRSCPPRSIPGSPRRSSCARPR